MKQKTLREGAHCPVDNGFAPTGTKKRRKISKNVSRETFYSYRLTVKNLPGASSCGNIFVFGM